jgi:antitoxin (DNA-binding transcriptional repressor) of toxin-antitoxin stability system
MATTQIELEKAADSLPQLVEEVSKAGEVILTKGDRPVARLVGYPDAGADGQAGKRHLDTAEGLITIADDLDEPLEDFDEYMR